MLEVTSLSLGEVKVTPQRELLAFPGSQRSLSEIVPLSGQLRTHKGNKESC